MNNDWVLPAGFTLRLSTEGDADFLLSLFYSARPELGLLPLPPEQLAQLMRQQYALQQHSYRHHYPHLEHWIIGTPSASIGTIMFERLQSAIHIIDFIIAPAWRGRGIGRSILVALKTHAHANVGSLSLQVDRQNINAQRLYHQLGFVTSQSSDTHEFLVWS